MAPTIHGHRARAWESALRDAEVRACIAAAVKANSGNRGREKVLITAPDNTDKAHTVSTVVWKGMVRDTGNPIRADMVRVVTVMAAREVRE